MKWIASASPREDDPHERHGPACRQAGRVVASLHSASREDEPPSSLRGACDEALPLF